MVLHTGFYKERFLREHYTDTPHYGYPLVNGVQEIGTAPLPTGRPEGHRALLSPVTSLAVTHLNNDNLIFCLIGPVSYLNEALGV